MEKSDLSKGERIVYTVKELFEDGRFLEASKICKGGIYDLDEEGKKEIHNYILNNINRYFKTDVESDFKHQIHRNDAETFFEAVSKIASDYRWGEAPGRIRRDFYKAAVLGAEKQLEEASKKEDQVFYRNMREALDFTDFLETEYEEYWNRLLGKIPKKNKFIRGLFRACTNSMEEGDLIESRKFYDIADTLFTDETRKHNFDNMYDNVKKAVISNHIGWFKDDVREGKRIIREMNKLIH